MNNRIRLLQITLRAVLICNDCCSIVIDYDSRFNNQQHLPKNTGYIWKNLIATLYKF